MPDIKPLCRLGVNKPVRAAFADVGAVFKLSYDRALLLIGESAGLRGQESYRFGDVKTKAAAEQSGAVYRLAERGAVEPEDLCPGSSQSECDGLPVAPRAADGDFSG